MTRAVRAYDTLARKKVFSDASGTATTQLAKVLTTIDLTALGVGSTLGVGIYVLAGEVSKTYAGPAVVVSFAIAAIASVMAGLCYAEFGSRVPRAGSAYIYSYVTIGEFVAFIIGWNLILEYSIGAASVAKALSTYMDALVNGVMEKFFIEHVPMNLAGLNTFVDFFALAMVLVFAIALAFGAKESTVINNVFTLINLAVVVFVIVTGCFLADVGNWSIPAADVPDDAGTGGFAPFGLSGIIRGAAVCFYGFIGFDVIATAGEETKNPKRSIPLSVIVSLSVIFAAYFTLSAVLTMALPYYAQDEKAPIVFMFEHYGWTVARYIVSIGAIFGLCASLMGSMFPLPRVVYAMAIDGLIFRFMGTLHPRFKTPMYGTLLAGAITGTLAAIFNLSQLVEMMSIGTLLAYSIVAACVMLLRYEFQPDVVNVDELKAAAASSGWLSRLVNSGGLRTPTRQTDAVVTLAVTMYCIWCALFAGIISLLDKPLFAGEWYAILLLTVAVVLVVGTLAVISRQPLSVLEQTFSAPFNPWLPGISILVNIYLMFQLAGMTWLRYGVWIAIGLCMYFGYGVWHSHERPVVKEERRRLRAEQQQQPSSAGMGVSESSVAATMTSSQEVLVTKKSIGE